MRGRVGSCCSGRARASGENGGTTRMPDPVQPRWWALLTNHLDLASHEEVIQREKGIRKASKERENAALGCRRFELRKLQ